MSDGTAALAPHEIALLRGGPRAAVTVALVALHLRGMVVPGPPGTVRAVPWDAATAELPPPFEDVVHSALDRPLRPRRLMRHPDVRPAVALTRVPLAEAGLPSRPFLGPPRAARREVAALRARHPLPARRYGLPDHDKLPVVAPHGEAALKSLVPRFAHRGVCCPVSRWRTYGAPAPPGATAARHPICGGGDAACGHAEGRPTPRMSRPCRLSLTS
jgi:hypothetical protein